jgi:hypothetical protein
MSEFTKIINRTGLLWYCPKCQPKLPDYFYGPGVKPSLAQLETKLDALTKIVTECHKMTKTYAQVTRESKEDSS